VWKCYILKGNDYTSQPAINIHASPETEFANPQMMEKIMYGKNPYNDVSPFNIAK
jgi:hypothetical protein